MSRILIAALAVAGLAFGAAPHVTAAEVATPASAKPAAAPIQGKLISVSGKQIVIQQKQDKRYINTDGKTEVVINGKKSRLEELRSDMVVAVTVEKDVATKIEVKPQSRK